jgi:methionine aminopeptidase
MTRDDLVDLIREAGEIVETALPVSSSVLKDQLTLMVMAELMRERVKFPPPEFLKMEEGMFGKASVAIGLTKLAFDSKDKEWVWQTYCEFMKRLRDGEP